MNANQTRGSRATGCRAIPRPHRPRCGGGQGGSQLSPAAEEQVIKPFELQPLFAAEAHTAQAHHIETADAVVAARHGEWRQILADGRAALHEGECSDAHKLMNQAIAGDEGAVADGHVPGQQRAVGHDDVVSEHDVMSDMAVRHQKIVRADAGLLGQLVRTMNRGMFAEDIVVANAQAGRLVLILQILRGVADHAAGVEAVVRANGRVAGQINVRPDDGALADGHRFVNNGVRSDLHG